MIVTGTDDQVRTLAARYGATVKKALRHGAVLTADDGQLDALSQDADVDHLAGDVPVMRMGVTTEAIGAEQVWVGALAGVRGFTGRGVGVAIIDSGVWEKHKDLKKRVVAQRRLHRRRRRRTATSTATGRTWPGLIVGGGADYPGVAPDASLISLRAMSADGSGLTSNVIAALDWAIDNRDAYNIRIVNLSLGHPVLESYRDDPLCQAVQRAVDAGILVVAVGGQFRQDRRRPGDRRRRGLAGQLAGGADGRGAEHQGDGAAVRRRDGDLQLARADDDRRRAEAGAGGAGQQDRVDGGAGLVPGRARIRSGWSRARRTATTSR